MRSTKTHSKTLKKKLNKCKNIFYAYNDIQFRFGDVLDNRSDIVEIKCNVRIDCKLGNNYTIDLNKKNLNKLIILIEFVV